MTHDNRPDKGSLREDQSRLMFGEGFSFSGYERDPLFLALPDGRYLDVAGCSGIDSLSDGRAGVFADFDNDGDLDVFLTTLQGESHLLFRNNVGQDNGFLRVVIEGDGRLGRDAFGAVARLRLGNQTLTKIHAGGMGYLSQHDPRLHFGLGDAPTVDAIEVTWPGATVETFQGPFPARSTLRLRAGTGKAAQLDVKPARLPDPPSRADQVARSLRFAVGQPLPDVPLVGLDGTATTLSALRRPGRRTLVNLWATWCTPCLAEMPELQALAPRLARAGVDLVGVSVDVEPDAGVQRFVRRTGVTYPIYLGGEPAVAAFYAGDELTVPLSILLDADGVVRELISGWSERTRHAFEALAR